MSFSVPTHATLPITLTLTVNSTLSFTKTLPFLKPHFPSYKFKSIISHCSISDREEHRWLREEQRWLREEQRWIREENRWNRERDELLREISELKLQIQSLERRILSSASSSSKTDAVANVASLFEVLKEKNLVLESGSSQRRLVFDEEEEEKETEEVVEDVKEIVVVEEPVVRFKKRNFLRSGSEGEDVQKLQEALLKLGFYSGEEDMEFSSFSSGTERAVKTWQASVGVTEDGIMTSELLDRLDLEIRTTDIGNVKETKKSTTVFPKEVENGAPVASVTEISEVQQNFADKVEEGTDVSSHPRVFLLGENRWEEPSRLLAKGAVGKVKNKNATTKCLQCSGLGILLCTECDGTGEPNIEPQFMEWVGEDTKCPYCEGLGHTICDLCGEKTKGSGFGAYKLKVKLPGDECRWNGSCTFLQNECGHN